MKVDFQRASALAFQAGPRSFGLVHDRAFLHTLDPSEWPTWVDLIAIALKPSGLMIAKEFAHNPNRHYGPRGFTKSELLQVLDERFRIEEFKESAFRGPRFAHAAYLLIGRRK